MEEFLNRREMLDLLLRASALPGAGAFFSPWLRAAQALHHHDATSAAPPQADTLASYAPKFFDTDSFTALQSFTEILIPTDEDPGAREAHCAAYIDFVLQASGEMPKLQSTWHDAMAAVKATGFYVANPEKKVDLVTQMSRQEFDPKSKHPAFFAYRLIKQQAAFAFYTSRVGMIQTLKYQGNSYNVTFPACTHPEHQKV